MEKTVNGARVAPPKMPLQEICRLVKAFELETDRLPTPLDFGHNSVLPSEKTGTIKLPELTDIRHWLALNHNDSAYDFVMRATGYSDRQMLQARQGMRETKPAPRRQKPELVLEPKPTVVRIPKKPREKQAAQKPLTIFAVEEEATPERIPTAPQVAPPKPLTPIEEAKRNAIHEHGKGATVPLVPKQKS